MTGSFLGQAWSSPGILHECQRYSQKLVSATTATGEMVVVFGSIGLMKNQNGVEQPASAIYVAQAGRQIASPGRYRRFLYLGNPHRAAAGHLVFLP